MSIKDKAITAYEEREVQRKLTEEQSRKIRLDVKTKFLKDEIKKILGLDIDPSTGRHTIEDMTFTVGRHRNKQNALILENGTCSMCGQPKLYPIESMADLGAALKAQTSFCNFCIGE